MYISGGTTFVFYLSRIQKREVSYNVIFITSHAINPCNSNVPRALCKVHISVFYNWARDHYQESFVFLAMRIIFLSAIIIHYWSSTTNSKVSMLKSSFLILNMWQSLQLRWIFTLVVSMWLMLWLLLPLLSCGFLPRLEPKLDGWKPDWCPVLCYWLRFLWFWRLWFSLLILTGKN